MTRQWIWTPQRCQRLATCRDVLCPGHARVPVTDAPTGIRPQLIRAGGRWDLATLALNMSVGSGIFGLPAVIAGLLGGLSPLAFIIAGAGMTVIALCLAEVVSRFHEAGGAYLYARLAFGRFAGLQVGWAYYLAAIAFQ
jgi:APA family basic amino acid/polyamine antiporter